MNAAKKTSRPVGLSFGKPFANGTASRKANSTCTPGRATRSSLSSSISSRVWRSSALSGMPFLFQPSLPCETTDLLDGAVDDLRHLRFRHDDATSPERKIPGTLPLAVFRVDVHDRLPQRLLGQPESCEPEPLDLLLLRKMVCEEVAGDPDLLPPEIEVLLEEIDEEPSHDGVGVRELKLISLLRTLSPIQHAPGDKVRIAQTCAPAPFFLKALSFDPPALSHLRPAAELAVVCGVLLDKSLVLSRCQLDVANTEADGGFRHAHTSCDLADGDTL